MKAAVSFSVMACATGPELVLDEERDMMTLGMRWTIECISVVDTAAAGMLD